MQLHPREQFTIVRQLQNPFITDTLYVRAVIRNAKTDAIIDTLNLTDKTGQRFTKNWLVPADVSGQGFWVSIVTSVYSDSGYTSKSENYGDEENTYLIQDRFNHNLGGSGGGGGPDIDYKKIKKMIEDAAKEIIAAIPEENNVITEKTIVKEVMVPEVRIVEKYSEPNLDPILKAVEIVGKKVDDKEVPKMPPCDHKEMMDHMGTMEKTMDEKFKMIDEHIKSMNVEIKLSDFLPSVGKQPESKPKVDERISKLTSIKI